MIPKRIGALVLLGPAFGLPELGCGGERPVGIAKHFSGQQHDVSLAAADDLIGLRGADDHADGTGGDADWFFEIPVGTDQIPSPPWPESIRSPHRDEIRSLVNRDLLEIDKSVEPTWRFWPSRAGTRPFPGRGREGSERGPVGPQ